MGTVVPSNMMAPRRDAVLSVEKPTWRLSAATANQLRGPIGRIAKKTKPAAIASSDGRTPTVRS
jgi:hypothetical protein